MIGYESRKGRISRVEEGKEMESLWKGRIYGK